jgi:hypothetical protein
MLRKLQILGEHKEQIPNQATIVLGAENYFFLDRWPLKEDGYNCCKEQCPRYGNVTRDVQRCMLDLSFGILEVSAHVMSKFVKFLLMRNVICCHSVSCCHLVMYPYNRWIVFTLRIRAKIGFTFHARTLSWNFVQKNLNYVTLCTIIMKAWKVYLITLKYTMMIYDYDSILLLSVPLETTLVVSSFAILLIDGCYVVCKLTALFGPLIDSRVRM